jgi:pyrroline-5-carboxylate reductase
MKIGLIGFGNLGKAFISGVIKSGFNCGDICITAKTQRTVDLARNLYPHIPVFSEKEKILKFSDVIILCVEPKNAKEVCQEIGKYSITDKTIVSFVSGIGLADLFGYFGGNNSKLHIIRAMPNIAISTCHGIIGLVNLAIEKDCAILKLFEQLGEIIMVREDDLEAITVSAASGLAFASVILSSYQDAIHKLLKDCRLSKEITLHLFDGVLSLIREEGISFDQLKNAVATKGGSTEAGLHHFDTNALNRMLSTALNAAYNRAKGTQN